MANSGDLKVDMLREAGQRIADRLSRAAQLIEVRGDGPGTFLFVQAGSLAAELSRCDGGFFVEFWHGGDADPPIGDVTVSSLSAAETSILDHFGVEGTATTPAAF